MATNSNGFDVRGMSKKKFARDFTSAEKSEVGSPIIFNLVRWLRMDKGSERPQFESHKDMILYSFC